MSCAQVCGDHATCIAFCEEAGYTVAEMERQQLLGAPPTQQHKRDHGAGHASRIEAMGYGARVFEGAPAAMQAAEMAPMPSQPSLPKPLPSLSTGPSNGAADGAADGVADGVADGAAVARDGLTSAQCAVKYAPNIDQLVAFEVARMEAVEEHKICQLAQQAAAPEACAAIPYCFNGSAEMGGCQASKSNSYLQALRTTQAAAAGDGCAAHLETLTRSRALQLQPDLVAETARGAATRARQACAALSPQIVCDAAVRPACVEALGVDVSSVCDVPGLPDAAKLSAWSELLKAASA